MSHLGMPVIHLAHDGTGGLALVGYRIDEDDGGLPAAHLVLKFAGATEGGSVMIAGSLADLGRLAATVFEAIATLEHADHYGPVGVDVRHRRERGSGAFVEEVTPPATP